MEHPRINGSPSFTLLELLVGIGLIAVLAAVVVVVIQPAELLARSRDTQRLNELGSINRVLSYLSATANASFGNPNTVYISVPDPALSQGATSTCPNMGLPGLPSGWSYRCVSSADLRKVNGSGWIPVDFTQFPSGAPFAALPIDPLNSTSSGNYYTYVTGGSWKLTALLESSKQAPTMAKDGGPDHGVYEIGSNLNLANFARGLVGYWKFDEGSATTARDSSGNNNNGTLTNGPTWTTGKVGSALSFDGVDDYVSIPSTSSLPYGSSARTVELWVYTVSSSWAIDANTIFGYGASATRQSFGIDMDTYPYIQFYTWGDGFLVDTGAPQEGWLHIAVTYDGGTALKAYINGIEKGSKTLGGISNTGITDIHIGRAYNLAFYYLGRIDEVRIYNRALSDAEIRAIYNATK